MPRRPESVYEPEEYYPGPGGWPLMTIRGIYSGPPVRDGDGNPPHGCRRCPHLAECERLEEELNPVRCEAPLALELDELLYFEGYPDDEPPHPLFSGSDLLLEEAIE